MNIPAQILILALAAGPAMALSAESECAFEDTTHRLISGNNPNDFRCIRSRAGAGDEHWEFYLGLILIGQVPGPTNVSEGLAVLKKVALRNNKYSADAMRSIGYVYKRTDGESQNYELAYQWLYLASQRPPFKGTAVPLPDETLSGAISSQRMKELERGASQLLRDR